MNDLIKQEWYKLLVDDCKAIITEAVFVSRWALVEGNWLLGERIRIEKNIKWNERGSGRTLQDLAKSIGQSERTLYYALQLYDKYPDINLLPEGKNISMNKLITKYLGNTLVNKFTGDNEWATPSEYIESSRIVMGSIDLDPASNAYAQQTVKAIKYFSDKDNGLSKKWEGNIFLNPPYATGKIDKFIDKLYEDIENINQFILLTNNNTDTNWFRIAVWISDLICFTKGRINFHKLDEISSPTNGQTFFYKGVNERGFINEFDKYGIIMRVVGG